MSFPYNIEFAMSTNLSVNVVKEMIRKVIEEQTGRKVAEITFAVGEVTDMRNESYKAFNGCTVRFISEKMSVPLEAPAVFFPGYN
jgi:hypothetical protein